MDQTLVLLPIYSNIAPTNSSLVPTNIPSDTPESSLSDPDLEFDFTQSLVILSPTKSVDIEGRFRREADALFVEAKRTLVVSHATIPVWVWGALCLLGYVLPPLIDHMPLVNEVSSLCVVADFVFLPSLLVASSSFSLRFNEFMAVVTNPLYFTTLLILIVSAYFTHRFGLSGPLIQVVATVYKEVHRQAVEKLKEAFAPDHHHSSESYPLEKVSPRLVPAAGGAGMGSGLVSCLSVPSRADQLRDLENEGLRNEKADRTVFSSLFQDAESLEQ